MTGWQKGLRSYQVVKVQKEAYRRGMGEIPKDARSEFLMTIRKELYPL